MIVFVVGYYGILELLNKEETPIAVYMTSLLYIFGLIWTGFMIKQNLSQ